MFAGLEKISTFASAIAEIAQLVEHNLAKVHLGPVIELTKNPPNIHL
ncbi:unknown [Bacteroides intestinalis CAG:564]|nr:unknown [Bacteroides intestinalis CAG:564]